MSEAKHRVLVEVPESWLPELEQAAKKRFTSRHSVLLQAVRQFLDGEKQ
jgi:metal-responsive CopG/Arc/MetJ family transcriptional regulator